MPPNEKGTDLFFVVVKQNPERGVGNHFLVTVSGRFYSSRAVSYFGDTPRVILTQPVPSLNAEKICVEISASSVASFTRIFW